MTRKTRPEGALTVHLPEPTLEAIRAFAAAGDIKESTIVSALLADHVEDLRQLTSVATRARGSAGIPLDDVYDLLAHLWMETAIQLAGAAGDEFPWRSHDERLRKQWAEDLAIFKLRKRLCAMARHEIDSDD